MADHNDVQVGDYVRQRPNARTSGITGKVISKGRVNVKVYISFQCAPNGPVFEQVHTLRIDEIDDVVRPSTTSY